MFQKIGFGIFLLNFIFSPALFAAETAHVPSGEKILGLFEKISEQVQYGDTEVKDPYCESCKAQPISVLDPILLSNEELCYRSICDSNAEVNSAQVLFNRASILARQQTVPKDVSQALDQFANEFFATELSRSEKILNLVKTGKLQLQTRAGRMVHAIAFFNSPFRSLGIKVDTVAGPTGSQLKYDTNELDRILSTFPTAESNFIRRTLNKWQKNSGGRNVYLAREIRPDLFLESQYPEDTLSEAAAKDAKEVLELYDSLDKFKWKNEFYFLHSRWRTINRELLIRLRDSNGKIKLSESEMADYWRSRRAIVNTATIMKDLNQQIVNYPIENLNGFVESQKVVPYLEQKKILLSSAASREALKSQFIKRCTSVYLAGRAALPTAKEIENFENQIIDYKNRIAIKIGGRLSVHSRGLLVKNLRRQNFSMPISQEGFQNQFLDSIRARGTDYRYRRAPWNANTKMAENEYDLISIYDKQYKDSKGVPQLATQMNEACEKFAIPLVADHAISGFGVALSWATIKNPALSQGLVLHELGHIITSEMQKPEMSEESRGKFQRFSQCIRSNNPNGAQYYSEDIADILSAQSMSEDGPNWICMLMPSGDTNKNRFDLIHAPSSSSNDKLHSPNFYRLLQTEWLKTSGLPVACQKVLGKQPIKSRPTYTCRLQ